MKCVCVKGFFFLQVASTIFHYFFFLSVSLSFYILSRITIFWVLWVGSSSLLYLHWNKYKAKAKKKKWLVLKISMFTTSFPLVICHFIKYIFFGCMESARDYLSHSLYSSIESIRFHCFVCVCVPHFYWNIPMKNGKKSVVADCLREWWGAIKMRK